MVHDTHLKFLDCPTLGNDDSGEDVLTPDSVSTSQTNSFSCYSMLADERDPSILVAHSIQCSDLAILFIWHCSSHHNLIAQTPKLCS